MIGRVACPAYDRRNRRRFRRHDTAGTRLPRPYMWRPGRRFADLRARSRAGASARHDPAETWGVIPRGATRDLRVEAGEVLRMAASNARRAQAPAGLRNTLGDVARLLSTPTPRVAPAEFLARPAPQEPARPAAVSAARAPQARDCHVLICGPGRRCGSRGGRQGIHTV